MEGFTISEEDYNRPDRVARLWVKRFEQVLDMDLPFEKIGIAHLNCSLIYRDHYLDVLQLIPDYDCHRLFAKAARCGVGIELNMPALLFTPEEIEPNYRMFRIAKEEGCRFYLGSDAHHPDVLKYMKENFERMIDVLELKEEDKFVI